MRAQNVERLTDSITAKQELEFTIIHFTYTSLCGYVTKGPRDGLSEEM